MAAPMSAADFLNSLRDEGLDVVEVGNWRTHNRNSKGPWGPVNGVMIHHTVTRGTATTVDICRNGYSTLPGPLCHGIIAKDGRVHLVGYGRANHAGLGDPDVLAAVISERQPPADNEATVDGNRHFYGWECENLGDGKDPWPDAQIEAIVRVITALCRHHDWTARSAIRHLDWQPGKVDPRGPGMDWDDILDRVAARLAGSTPSTPKPPAPKPLPKPTRPVVDLSKLVAAAKSNPGRRSSRPPSSTPDSLPSGTATATTAPPPSPPTPSGRRSSATPERTPTAFPAAPPSNASATATASR
jgi:hypothetical protein